VEVRVGDELPHRIGFGDSNGEPAAGLEDLRLPTQSCVGGVSDVIGRECHFELVWTDEIHCCRGSVDEDEGIRVATERGEYCIDIDRRLPAVRWDRDPVTGAQVSGSESARNAARGKFPKHLSHGHWLWLTFSVIAAFGQHVSLRQRQFAE
jgi:hypothetical protein